MPATASPDIAHAPFRKVHWGERDIAVERRPDGVVVLRSRLPLKDIEPHLPASLARWAAQKPDATWLAQRRGPQRDWLRLTWAEAKRQVDGLTQALLDLKLEPGRVVTILSGNSIEHALFTMAAMQARLAAAPISPAYSLMSQDHAKLKFLFDLVKPAVVLVQDGPTFQRALDALPLAGVHLVHVDRAPERHPSRAFAELAATPVTAAVEASIARITGDTIGKLLFTSGSTGMPKAVINTQRMMCANVAQMQQVRRHIDGIEPVYLDWMPWNHTMGGNALFNPVLTEGGTLYIDDGRPLPGQIEETLRNLREVKPTYYANVPAGYAALAAAMEKDEDLCRAFFQNLRLMAYGGARLPDDLYERMQALAVKTTGERIVFYTGWGSTETAPTSTGTYWETERVGLIGLPFPGVELKMVPVTGDKYELRLKGINVMPGYYGRPDLTAAAFDDEGFYKIGDAGTFVDPADPAKGLWFAGRVAEDFKLTTGTFVHVGPLRTNAIAAATPVLLDALVTGQDRPYIGLLCWPNLHACRQIVGHPEATFEQVIQDPRVIAALRKGLAAHNAEGQGASSLKVARALLMAEPPSIDGNELTDKGYINQRAGLERRAALVDRLYADPPAADVIVLD